MKKFKLQGEATFYAEDIDDALNKLALHFLLLSKGEDSQIMDVPTNLELKGDQI